MDLAKQGSPGDRRCSGRGDISTPYHFARQKNPQDLRSSYPLKVGEVIRQLRYGQNFEFSQPL